MLILSSKTIIELVYEEIANSDSQVNETMLKEGAHLDHLRQTANEGDIIINLT